MSSGYEEATPNDVLVVLSPGVDDHWTRAAAIQAKTKVPTLALAPPFSLRCVYLTGKRRSRMACGPLIWWSGVVAGMTSATARAGR